MRREDAIRIVDHLLHSLVNRRMFHRAWANYSPEGQATIREELVRLVVAVGKRAPELNKEAGDEQH